MDTVKLPKKRKPITDFSSHSVGPKLDSLASGTGEKGESTGSGTGEPHGLVIDPDDLINRSYLMDPNDEGEKFRATIMEKIVDHQATIDNDPEKLKFLIRVGNDKADEIRTYNEVLDYINREAEHDLDPDQQTWRFKEITAHEGPLKPGDPSYKGSSYNVMIAWEDGTHTFEPLHIFAADAPEECARYAKAHGLLDMPGWKRFRKLAKREKQLLRMLNQAKLPYALVQRW